MLDRILSPYVEFAYALLRMGAGVMFAFHGYQKLFGAEPPAVGSQMWLGAVIELLGGLLIAVGLGTVYAAFLASGTMAVAYAQFHWKGALDANFFPINNKGELALLYCLVFFYFAFRGSGRYSLDAAIRRRA
jgi:putative oxidoreductase